MRKQTEKFKVIVAGTRDFDDEALLFSKLDRLLQNRNSNDLEIVSGTARGADQLGEAYAHARGISVRRFPADWNRLGKRAGYFRNEEMAKYADALVAFWDGYSRGTRNMIDLAQHYKLDIRVILYFKKEE